ncbi:hypothetical protein OQ279_02430 [Salinimicrobium sp. MT39]|uniref:Hydrolase n=1 Tax=Salinimicrobium profundisediminis TaxID=2994553 RepID=A0A9X3CUF7_9FLAO|nr:hypothetical protein [Salinimicrobium profundisediminis]MCX2836997.1 hypothetical protein [Salinimicrobium profundisediminis]
MRKSFLMYLFVFTALLAVVFYMNGSKVLASKEKEIEYLKKELEEQRANAQPVAENASQEKSFSLASNEEALSYLEDRGLDPADVMNKVEEALVSRNAVDADNDLIPYEGMNGPFRINKVKLLNHKWAIASFTDGLYWGDLFVSFEIDDNGTVEIFTEKALLYPRN